MFEQYYSQQTSWITLYFAIIIILFYFVEEIILVLFRNNPLFEYLI